MRFFVRLAAVVCLAVVYPHGEASSGVAGRTRSRQAAFLPHSVRHFVTQPNAPRQFPSALAASNTKDDRIPNVVLVAGFESFNRDLYKKAAEMLPEASRLNIRVFADTEIRGGGPAMGIKKKTQDAKDHTEDDEYDTTNPEFRDAVLNADAFIGSLIFDYDDVLAVRKVLSQVQGPRLLFECATELMELNQVGSFNMMPKDDGSAPGPPPAVKAVLSRFSSGKEEDRLSGYIKLLKIGPDLLKFVPGDRASDLRTWLEAYRYWNQGGLSNASAMLQLLTQRCLKPKQPETASGNDETTQLPELQVTPDLGLLHPLLMTGKGASVRTKYFTTPKEYVKWRESQECQRLAEEQRFKLAPTATAPRVAVLLYRKHVITGLDYIPALLRQMEAQGIMPIPIFINGIEAHTVVRDLLTSQPEIKAVAQGKVIREETYKSGAATPVDAIVNTIGFPLVGGPAGSMEAGRNVDVAEAILKGMNVPYIVGSPLLLQSIPQWKSNGVLGLQSVALYSLPELDGAVDTVVLGGLVGDKIALVPERVRKLTGRVQGWVDLRRTPPSDRKIAVVLYGFPPNVGAVGTAALLDVPSSLERLLYRLHAEGYDVGGFATDPDASGQSLVAALAVMCEDSVVARGAQRMEEAIQSRIDRAKAMDVTVAETLGRPGGGLGGAAVCGFDITRDELDEALGRFMASKVRRAWSEKERGPGISAEGKMVVSGLQLGNVWITVQPLLGVEGDPMRLLFERDLTPHPQYCAAYEWMKRSPTAHGGGGIGAQAVIHLGMHGTVEWLPGQPLGNDRQSWSDELLGNLPNVYLYAVNNPSESILAKRRGYGTLVSYNVPPYGRAGLYLELANLKELLDEYRSAEAAPMEGREAGSVRTDLRDAIFGTAQTCGILSDVPLVDDVGVPMGPTGDLSALSTSVFDAWVSRVSEYLAELQNRLFSSGLHVLGNMPSNEQLASYLEAYLGDELSSEAIHNIIDSHRNEKESSGGFGAWWSQLVASFQGEPEQIAEAEGETGSEMEATTVVSLLRKTTEELDTVMNVLDGGYAPPAPGGDLLRDGTSVLPTGRNIHALDPYRMPSAGAWIRGQRIAEETIRQHREANDGAYPETVAVTLWGLDAIKTKGESVAIALALVGAKPVKEGTGRIVRFDLVPLEELGRPRVDVLATLSGIFRDSFGNIVDLLDDMFERAAIAEDEPLEMNFVKKHAADLTASGAERPAARLFSNPPGDFGSMVNEVVGSGDWDESESLGETWRNRNVFSYGRNEGGPGAGSSIGTARPEVLDKLLETTERVVQEVDSVEYGLTDIQEYYANTGALKKAAENRKPVDAKTGQRKKVTISVVEAFGIGGDEEAEGVPVRNVEDVLRLEYRSKLLNPKWRDAMLQQGSGGAYEVSQRFTAMVGWSATAEVDNFVFDQASERYALDETVAATLRKANPEAFKNVIRRLLEAAGRGMWDTDEETLEKLRDLYSEADDLVEQVGTSGTSQTKVTQ